MLDTILISNDEFWSFSEAVVDADLAFLPSEIAATGSGRHYSFEMRDRGKLHRFSWIGKPKEKAVQRFMDLCDRLFDAKFSQIPCLERDLVMKLNVQDRTRKPTLLRQLNITKVGPDISVKDSTAKRNKHLSSDAYIDLCRILENNHVWKLASNHEFGKKYPQEYFFSIRQGDLSNSFRVYAPSRLGDRRYFNILNAVESLGVLSDSL